MDALLQWIYDHILFRIFLNEGIYWGDLEMMKPYDGWYDYIKNMFHNMGWGTLFLIAASAILWTFTYLFIINRLHKDHAPSMPWVCLCMNFSWEFQFAFLVPYPEPVTRFGIYFWVAFDLIMYILDLRYGKLFFHRRFKGYDWGYYPTKVLLFVIIFISILMMNPQWPTLPDSPMFAAYLMNAIMSMLFCVHSFSKETIEGLSLGVAWTKWLGTVAPTIIGLYWMPGQYFVYCLAFICCAFDMLYMYLLITRFIRFGVNPLNRKPIKGKEAEYEKTMAHLADYYERSAAYKLKSYKECQVELAEDAEKRMAIRSND